MSGSTPRLMSAGTSSFVYGMALAPLIQIAGSTSDLLIADSLGSVHGLVQLSTGSLEHLLVNYTDYDGYGNPTNVGGLAQTHTALNVNWSITSPFGYSGSYQDPTSLTYLLHRYLDPATGQFLSIDPEELVTESPYQYANDNPVTLTDAMGALASFVNPFGCIAYIGNAHWANSNPANLTVKVNGSIQDCAYPPAWGTIHIQLYKTGFFYDYLQADTTVTSLQPGSPWYWQKPSKGAWQMWDNNTQKKCTYSQGTTSTFYGVYVYGAIMIGGVTFSTQGEGVSAGYWSAQNCWTSS